MEFSEYRLNDNPGVMKGKLSSDLFDNLKYDIEKSKRLAIPKNNRLIGQIENEFVLTLNSDLQNFLLSAAESYQKLFEYELNKKPSLVEHWLNVQKKHEYNPVHHHQDALAWVIWVNIPYDLDAEMNHPNCKNTKMKRNSVFEFVYSSLSGDIKTNPIFLSKKDEGTILLFHCKLKHVVYPFFTSDGERISVAGNIALK